MKIILFAIITLLATNSANAQLEKLYVHEVKDAQVLTVVATDTRDTMLMILAGMVCPGVDQPYGKEARAYVANAILNKTVRVDLLSAEKDGIVGLVWDANNKLITEELIKKGLATADDREPQWVKLEEEARKKKLGIWKDSKPVDLEKDWAEHHMKGLIKQKQ